MCVALVVLTSLFLDRYVVLLAEYALVGGGCICQNELDLLQRIQHSNIVSLVGFCIHEENRFIVYELMENGSLETQLHGSINIHIGFVT